MIDEDRTMQLFGYTSTDLFPTSGEKVVVVCEECGRYRVVRRVNVKDLCLSCSLLGLKPNAETRLKMSVSASRRKASIETRLKISEAGKNRPPVTEDTRRKLSEANGGKNHWNWKGGITPWRDGLLHTRAYKNWRTAVFERDDYTCQMCDARGGYLEAHHIRPVRDHKNDLMLYDVDNGITLCKKCHATTKNREYDFIQMFNEKV